jgi:glutaredoxin 3
VAVAGAVVAGTAAAHPDREYPAACRRLSFLVPRISLYTTQGCGYCMRAKALLDARGLRYEEISLDDDPAFRQVVFDLGRRWTVPLVLIDGEPIGGYDELAALDRSGLLAERLAA